MENAGIHFKNRADKYNHSSNWVEDQALIRRIFELSGAGKDSQVLDIATGTGLIAAIDWNNDGTVDYMIQLDGLDNLNQIDVTAFG